MIKVKIEKIVIAKNSGSLDKLFLIQGFEMKTLLHVLQINKAITSEMALIIDGHNKIKQDIKKKDAQDSAIKEFNDQEIELGVNTLTYDSIGSKIENFSSEDLLNLDFLFC